MPACEIEVRQHPVVIAAEKLATHAHSNAVRKFSGDPYIVHPRDVFDRFCHWVERRSLKYKPIEPEDVIIGAAACWLHDVKEDCQDPDKEPFIQDEDIIQACGEFGGRVFKLVAELTNPSKFIEPRPSRHVRKKIDRQHLAKMSWMCRSIKAIDRTANLNDMRGCDDPDFLSLYCMESRRLVPMLHQIDADLEKTLIRGIITLEYRIEQLDKMELSEMLRHLADSCV